MTDSERMWAALDIEARNRKGPRPRLGLCLAWALVLFGVTCWVVL